MNKNEDEYDENVIFDDLNLKRDNYYKDIYNKIISIMTIYFIIVVFMLSFIIFLILLH